MKYPQFSARLALVLLALIATMASVVPVRAQPLVANSNDSGPGSLRQAILNATNGATLTFAPNLSGATILLTSGELLLDKNLIIDASALPNGLTLNGNNSSRIFNVPPEASVVLTALTLTNGTVEGGFGGGIRNNGTMTVNHSTLAGNRATFGHGGGIFNVGTLTVNQSTLAGNLATFGGGGICNDSGGTLTLNQSTITANQAGGGGGLCNYGTLNLFNSIVAGNSASPFSSNIEGQVNNPTGVNLTDVDPLLAPLGSYGGPTQTMPPLPGSPALDGCTSGTSFATDQRGFPRPVGAFADIGAVETTVSLVVTMNADAGAGSLRYAVAYTTNGSTITFAPHLSGATILLTSGQLTLDKSLTIDGSSLAGGIQINGGASSRIFHVTGGSTVSLNSLTITNGSSSSGGGIFNDSGCRLTISNTTLAGNVTTSGSGGAIMSSGALTVSHCTFSGNTAADQGGAVGSVASAFSADNSTFVGNIAGNYGGACSLADGGPAAVFEHVTVVSNTASTIAGGGIFLAAKLATIANSIVALNSSPAGPDIYVRNDSVLTSSGVNLVVNLTDSTLTAGPGVLTGDPLLAALGSYGGPTRTMPPLPGSPAINAGAATGFTTDQRGFLRLYGVFPDIGAVEFQHASPVVVNNADSGLGSLRHAVAYTTNGSTITFAPHLSGATILLTSGHLLLTNNLTIDASALPNGLILNGNNTSRIFLVPAGANVVLTALTLTNGNGYFVDGVSYGGGGGIYNRGTLMVNQCTLTGNQASRGSSGGGIANEYLGTLTVNQCTLTDNHTEYGGDGGGILNHGTLTVNQSTLTGNYTEDWGGSGGGIYTAGMATVNHSTLAGNHAELGVGGGIYNGGYLTVNQSTLTGNYSLGGSAIYTHTILTVNQSTLVGNGTQGDAVIHYDGTLNLFNSIVAGRLQEQHILSIFNPTGVNLTNGDPLLDLRLAPLGSYGGPTQTMPPLPGSPAIDGCTNGTSFASDQRGLPRISGLFADIGAAELQIVTATNPPVVTGLTRPGNGSFQFSFANLAGASFTVFASTNLALPFNAWENLGPAVETPAASGQFQFTDPEATNKVLRFYRIRSP